jgi:hypothetical protein
MHLTPSASIGGSKAETRYIRPTRLTHDPDSPWQPLAAGGIGWVDGRDTCDALQSPLIA